jgi:serine/threonine protein kinase
MQGDAWLDVKPANIVLYSSDSDSLTKLVGIDVDHGVSLHTTLESLPAVTWTYAAPEIARKVVGEGMKVYAEQCDLWSLGIAAMEIFNKGQSFFPCTDDKLELKNALRGLTTERIEVCTGSWFGGHRYHVLRHFLKQTLRISPEEQTPAVRLISAIDGTAERGITDLESKIDDVLGKAHRRPPTDHRILFRHRTRLQLHLMHSQAHFLLCWLSVRPHQITPAPSNSCPGSTVARKLRNVD